MSIPYLHPYLSYRHYPAAYGRHLHAQLASIHHDELLRQQAELQRYYRTNRQLFAKERIAKYEDEIIQRQVRLAEMKDRGRIISQLERNRFEGLKVEEELRYQQTLRQMEVDRYLRRAQIFLPQKINSSHLTGEQILKGRSEQRINKFQYNSQAKDRPTPKYRQTGSIPQRRQSQQKDIRKSLMRNYQSQALRDKDRIRNVNPNQFACFFDKSKGNHNQINKRQQKSNTSFKNTYLSDGGQRHSPKIVNKKNRRVTFSLQKTAIHNRSGISQQQMDHILTPIATNRPIVKSKQTKIHMIPAKNASKRIENRLKLSSVIYKDSQWRNTKHENVHLFNTFENEVRLRQQIKTKINNNPKIISRYCIVVEEK